MSAVFFYYLAAVTLVSGLLTITLRSPVHCGLALVTLLLHIAGFFILLNAEFLAAVQVIVYAGAILVLYLFVIMLLNLKTEERVFHRRYGLIAVIAVGISGQIALLVLRSPYAGAQGTATQERVLAVGQTRALGITMFSDYLLQFEIIGVFLLAAIIGAIVLTKTSTVQGRQVQAGSAPGSSNGSEAPDNGTPPHPEAVIADVGAGRGGGTLRS